MKILKVLYFLIGIALLAVVLAGIEAAEVGRQLARVGPGFAIILAVFFAAFALDSVSWQLTIPGVPLNARWAVRTWLVRMIGEAFNMVMPAAGFGGEPVKAVLLKRHYGTGYGDATASLILTRTINLIALIAFLIVGFALMMDHGSLPAAYRAIATAGLVTLGFGVFGFFLVQRFGFASRAGAWLARRRAGGWLNGVLHHIADMDVRLIRFYRDSTGRFAGAFVLALLNWLLGVVEVYLAMDFLGHPISWSEAWIIEAMAQMVRTGTFFIPLSIGAQEGAFVLVCGAITGLPSVGVSVSVVRRAREVIWIVAGFALGSGLSMRPAPPPGSH